MATAISMLTRSMRLIGAIGKGETPDEDEATDGLSALNTMLDSWRLERLLVYQILQTSHTWPASTTSRTIGTGGNLNVARPVKIDSAFVRDSNNQDFQMEILEDRTQYDGIAIKSTTSTFPDLLFYDTAFPLGTIYVYPVPSEQVTLLLNTWQALQSFSSLTTTLALPPGYQRAIEYGLGIEIAPEYGRTVSAEYLIAAVQSKAAIMGMNRPSMIARVDDGLARLSL